MRTVLRSHNEVCHVWASRTQENGGSGNINFRGNTIFSYGHWSMASFVDDSDIVLYRDDTYSISTSRHQCFVRRAISHCRVFKVASLNTQRTKIHVENIAHYIWKLRELADSFWAGLRGRGHFDRYIGIVKEAREYAEYFKCKDLLPPLFGLELSGKKAQENLRKQIERQARAEQKAIERYAAKQARRKVAEIKFNESKPERLAAWLRGDIISSGTIDGFWFHAGFEHTMLRLTIDKDVIETSDGAFIPIKAGRLLYKAIKSGRPVHGFTVGHYTVKGFVDGVLTVGCHEIPIKEIERFAAVMNWSK